MLLFLKIGLVSAWLEVEVEAHSPKIDNSGSCLINQRRDLFEWQSLL